jgi:hypothetical protein
MCVSLFAKLVTTEKQNSSQKSVYQTKLLTNVFYVQTIPMNIVRTAVKQKQIVERNMKLPNARKIILLQLQLVFASPDMEWVTGEMMAFLVQRVTIFWCHLEANCVITAEVVTVDQQRMQALLVGHAPWTRSAHTRMKGKFWTWEDVKPALLEQMGSLDPKRA